MIARAEARVRHDASELLGRVTPAGCLRSPGARPPPPDQRETKNDRPSDRQNYNCELPTSNLQRPISNYPAFGAPSQNNRRSFDVRTRLPPSRFARYIA